MWRTNLNILLVLVVTLGVYTLVSNIIPQVESDVPEAAAVEIGPETTPEELVSIGERIYEGVGGCTACHAPGGARAPELLGVAGRNCELREPELSCKEYLYRALVDPHAYVVEGYEPIMPSFEGRLSEAQLWSVVAFLEDQGGEVTVAVEDIAVDPLAEEPPAPDAPPPDPDAPPPVGLEGPALVEQYGCMACHQLAGEGGPVGPAFEEVRGPRDRLRRAILDPAADTTPGYEAFAGTMPTDFGERMTAAELEALLDFLERLR